jgi:hypothetical protein
MEKAAPITKEAVVRSLGACAASAGLTVAELDDGRLAACADGRPVLILVADFRPAIFDLQAFDMTGEPAGGRRFVRYAVPEDVRFVMSDVERAMRLASVHAGILPIDQLPSNAMLRDFVHDLSKLSVRDEPRLRWDAKGIAATTLVDRARAAIDGGGKLTRGQSLRLLRSCIAAADHSEPEPDGVGFYMMCLRAKAIDRGRRMKPIAAWEWDPAAPEDFMRPRVGNALRTSMAPKVFTGMRPRPALQPVAASAPALAEARSPRP